MDDLREKINKLREYVEEAQNVVFFGGAGVSTESGVPDFRSKDGLYNQHDVRFDKYYPEYLLSHSCLVNEPEVFFEFYRQKLDTHGIEPNAAHKALAELERLGKLTAVLTQNIDGLHQAASLPLPTVQLLFVVPAMTLPESDVPVLHSCLYAIGTVCIFLQRNIHTRRPLQRLVLTCSIIGRNMTLYGSSVGPDLNLVFLVSWRKLFL